MDLLNQIHAAWPSSPYPGDHLLSDCWCVECEFSVSSLRGKSWKQLRPEDVGGETGHMSPEAFRYYIPGILSLSVQDPDEINLSCEINVRFVFSDHSHERPESQENLARLVGSLSQRQRKVLVEYFEWLAHQDWQAPLLIDAAKRAVGDRIIKPYSYDALDRWNRERAAELQTGA
jgi:hypothetical protein